jgi:glycosyltransferase involved in cell wall biosynthesis
VNIAIMMRAIDQDSGHSAFIEGMVEHMLRLAPRERFLLLFRTPRWLDRFAGHENATQRLVEAPHKLYWDQVAVPRAAAQLGADVIFNPKFSVPLVSPCPVVMGLQEPAWWAWPDHYEWLDRNYMKRMLPLYVRKSKHLFPISQFIVDENRKYLHVPFEDKCTVYYPAPRPHFRPVKERATLDEVRREYDLPSCFIATVTRVDHPGLDGSSSFFPGKNVHTTVRAFTLIRDRVPHHLVIAGRRVRDYLTSVGFTARDLERIHFLDYVHNARLPALLTLADLFVIPSFYESYAMSLVEAMTCGCPVVASKTGACPEITAGAALLADPNDPEDFAHAMERSLGDETLRRQLKARSLERAGFFDWDRATRLILARITQVVNGAGAHA